jgi:molybdopterin converting factor small subunit
MVRVLLFAQAAVLAGTDSCAWPILEPQGAQMFWGWLLGRHPDLSALRNVCRLARNGEYLQEDGLISPGDELAVLPPFSGG